MARYIDADALIEFITKGLNNPDNTKAFGYDAIVILTEIEYAPTADVVPKSEVDRLQAEVKVLTENSITSKYPCCVSCSRGLILTKSLEEYDKLLADIANEVAREIFEEIEKVMLDGAIGGKYPAKVINPDKYAELKKKYTEGEK